MIFIIVIILPGRIGESREKDEKGPDADGIKRLSLTVNKKQEHILAQRHKDTEVIRT